MIYSILRKKVINANKLTADLLIVIIPLLIWVKFTILSFKQGLLFSDKAPDKTFLTAEQIQDFQQKLFMFWPNVKEISEPSICQNGIIKVNFSVSSFVTAQW